MANDDLRIEILDTTAIVVSEGLKDGIKEWAKEPVMDFVKSLFLRTFMITCGSSLAGVFALSLGRILVAKWRALAAKSPETKIVDGIRYAELILNEYGDLLDYSWKSRRTRDDMLLNALDHLYDAYTAAERSNEAGLAKRIRFLMGLCGLMREDTHTRMFNLDPFIEEVATMKKGFEKEASDGAEMYAEASNLETAVVELLVIDRAVKNAFALYGPMPFHCGKEQAAWTGTGTDPLGRTIDAYAKKNKIPDTRRVLIEKLVIFLILKEYRDKKIAECDTFVRSCQDRTIHGTLRPAFGKKRAIGA
jgi:hypothetical protein